jgi:hypothetical protein
MTRKVVAGTILGGVVLTLFVLRMADRPDASAMGGRGTRDSHRVVPLSERQTVAAATVPVENVPARPASPTLEEPDADYVVDWIPTSDDPPRTVWEKEDEGWKVVLDEAGGIIVSTHIDDESRHLTPNEMAQIPARMRLHAEARRVRRERLPMLPRAEWEAKQRARAEAAVQVKVANPQEFGFRSLEEMKASYLAKMDLTEGQDLEFYQRRNAHGKFELEVMVTAVAPGDPEF